MSKVGDRSEQMGEVTHKHVRPEVVNSIDRICVVGLESCACRRRDIDMLAFDGRKASLLERYRGAEPAADSSVEKVKGRVQWGLGRVEEVGDCCCMYGVETAQDCEEKGKQRTANEDHG